MATFGRLTDFINNALEFDERKMFLHVFSRDWVKELIVGLNTEEQLFMGIDSKGVPLDDIGGSYEESTIKRKTRKGQPTDRVTLKDTGRFYNSFVVDVFPDEIVIEADYIKSSEDLRKRWGINLAGLTDESKTELIEIVMPEIKEYILSQLLK